MLVSRGGATDVVNEPAVTTLPPSITTTSISQEQAPGITPSSWARIDVGDMVASGVATGPTGSVALGGGNDGPYAELNTAWFSEDGEAWQPLAVPSGGDITYGDPGFVIVGHTAGHLATTASFSPDGVTWFTPPIEFDGTEPLLPGTYNRMEAVTYGNETFLAVGEVIDFGTQIEEVRLGVWRSGDGQTWTAVPQDQLTCGPGCITDVTYGASGFVAIGLADLAPEVAIWHSPDGNTWKGVAQLPEMQSLGTVAYGDGGYITLGQLNTGDDESLRSAIWHSTDGVSWEMVTAAAGSLTDVVFGDGAYLAVGSVGNSAAVWHSIDGVTWTQPDYGPDIFANAAQRTVGYMNENYIILGEEAEPGNPAHGWLWISK